MYCKGKEVYYKGRCIVLQYTAGIHCWECIAIKGIVLQLKSSTVIDEQ